MSDFSGDLNELLRHMESHNTLFTHCIPTQCDTLDQFTVAVEAWLDDLTEPNRVQMVTALLVAITNVSRRHINSDWYSMYGYPENCS